MDRLKSIEEKSHELLGADRGPVYLFDVAAGLCLVAYAAILVVERSFVSNDRTRKPPAVLQRLRTVLAFLSMAWLLTVAAYGSVWTKLPQHKLFPMAGFFCIAIIEGLEIYQRRSEWVPELFLRHTLTGVALGALLVHRLSSGPKDIRFLLVPIAATLPLFSFLLWPKQSNFQARPVPRPDGTPIVFGSLLAAWLLATINYGVPSYITGVRGKVFRGAMLGLLAGVAVFFAQLSGGIASWFARFQANVTMAPYAIFAMGSLAFVAVLVAFMGHQQGTRALALIWTPLLIATALGASLLLNWPAKVPKNLDGESNLPLSEQLTAAIADFNATRDPAQKLDVEILRLAAITPDRIPNLVRRNVAQFHVPWMLRQPVREGSVARIGSHVYPAWSWIHPGDGTEASIRSRNNLEDFLRDGPYRISQKEGGIASHELPADIRNLPIFSLVFEGSDMSVFKSVLSYGTELETLDHHLGHLAYLSRRIDYWHKLLQKYAALKPQVAMPEGVTLTGVPSEATTIPQLLGLLKLANGGSPFTVILRDRQETPVNMPQLFQELEAWLALYRALPATYDAKANMTITLKAEGSIGGSTLIDLAPYTGPQGDITLPSNLALTSAEFQHGPGDHAMAYYYMLLYLMSDLRAMAELHRGFWRPIEGGADARGTEGQLLEWMSGLAQGVRTEEIFQRVPVHASVLRDFFQWTTASGEWFISREVAPMMQQLLIATHKGGLPAMRAEVIRKLGESTDVRHKAIARILTANPTAGPWTRLREWLGGVVEESAALSLLLFVSRPDPGAGPKTASAGAEQSLQYPLEALRDDLKLRTVQLHLWDPDYQTRLDAFREVTRHRNFGIASALQTGHNFLWLAGLFVILGLSFRREQSTLLVGLFGNFEGLGAYRRYVYGAVFVLLAVGILQLLSILRFETLRNQSLNGSNESLPYLIFFAATALYLAPGLVHQITQQQMRTLYFLVLFFVFLFFAPLRPFLPLPSKTLDKWNLLGERYTNRLNAVASGVTLFLLVIMVAFGFFDRDRAWPTWLQVVFCVLLILCSAFAAPLYVLMRDLKEDVASLPSDIAQFARTADQWQQDTNKGIFFSFISLLITGVVTWKYLRNPGKPYNASSRKVPKTVHEMQFVDDA